MYGSLIEMNKCLLFVAMSIPEKDKASTEVSMYGVNNTPPIRPPDSRIPLPNPSDRYSAPTLQDLGRSGFQPYRPEERYFINFHF